MIQNVSDSEIKCVASSNEAGSYPIIVQILSNGLSNSNILFTYNFSINSVSNLIGSYGGGLKVTLSGDGFSKSNTSILLCNKICETNNIANNFSTVTFTVII